MVLTFEFIKRCFADAQHDVLRVYEILSLCVESIQVYKLDYTSFLIICKSMC